MVDSVVNCKESAMSKIESDLLLAVSDLHQIPSGAFNIRENGQAVDKRSTENIEIVPIEVERYPTQIVVHSPMDGVNCNIANADALIPDRIISTEENMWVVNRGDTVFQIERPKRLEGIVVSIFGGICMMLLWIMVYVVLEIPVREQEEG